MLKDFYSRINFETICWLLWLIQELRPKSCLSRTQWPIGWYLSWWSELNRGIFSFLYIISLHTMLNFMLNMLPSGTEIVTIFRRNFFCFCYPKMMLFEGLKELHLGENLVMICWDSWLVNEIIRRLNSNSSVFWYCF